MVRWEIFSHLTMKFAVTQSIEVDQNYTHKYAGNAVSRCFTSVPEILGFDFSRKNGGTVRYFVNIC